MLLLFANLLIPSCLPLNAGILLRVLTRTDSSSHIFSHYFVCSQSIISHIYVYQPSDHFLSPIFYKIPEIYFQSSTTSMDNQGVTKNDIHSNVFCPYTNAPISSFPILVHNITFFLSPRLKTMMLALTLLIHLPPTFISKFKRVCQI